MGRDLQDVLFMYMADKTAREVLEIRERGRAKRNRHRPVAILPCPTNLQPSGVMSMLIRNRDDEQTLHPHPLWRILTYPEVVALRLTGEIVRVDLKEDFQ